MALVACKECGHMISRSAKFCARCGHKLRRISLLTWIIVGSSVVIFINTVIVSNRQDQKKEKVVPQVSVVQEFQDILHPSPSGRRGGLSPEELRKEKIEKQFSSLDGSHYELTKYIKKSMNDTDSYEHVETTCIDAGDYIMVKTTFRGKDLHGGVDNNWISAKVDLEGNVIEVIEQGQ